MEDGLEPFMCPPPPLPYIKGRRFTARSHNPLPPERRKTDCCMLQGERWDEWGKVTPLERCLRHPPPDGSYNDSTVEFEIADTIRAGLGHCAQVLLVKILQGPSSILQTLGDTTAVVKIYDPLYWDHEEGEGEPFHGVNHHYTHEVASYNRLSDLQGTMIPMFYGSYALDIPVDHHPSATTRSVRLIIMEHIRASSMLELKPEDFSQQERKCIMKLLIDGESAIYARDILLADLHPRNVLVEKGTIAGGQNGIRRVVHIDFGSNHMSRFWWADYGGAEKEKKFLPGVFISPIIRWHVKLGRTKKFQEWIDWEYQRWVETEYANTLPSITPEVIERFLPPSSRGRLDAKTRAMLGLEETA
ncbi:hypothetical protein FQN54_000295 [Arachnomyces sp. PD_36]|nr:hypothetical protein FQN54_000295 [Arachnomyces sp. PD_36]